MQNASYVDDDRRERAPSIARDQSPFRRVGFVCTWDPGPGHACRPNSSLGLQQRRIYMV